MKRLILVALLVVGCGAAEDMATPPVTPGPTATMAPPPSPTPDAAAGVRHIVDAIDRLALVSVSGDEAIREWTSAEIEWITANPNVPENVEVAYIILLTELLTAESSGEDMAEAVARVRNARSVFADLLPPE